jgi:hypothetical protein
MADVSCVSTVDWAATGTMLQGWGALLGAVSIGAAAWIGRNTFESWRQQKLAERRIEQAERILTATYKVRRGLAYVRSPMMMAHEFAAAEEKLKENGEWEKIVGGDRERDRFRTTQAYLNRLSSTIEDRKLMEECQPMARALFSENLEQAIEKLNRQFQTVRIYVDANHNARTGADKDHRAKIESTIWSGYPSPDDNEMDQTITAQVKLIEDICLPVLRLEGPKSRRS